MAETTWTQTDLAQVPKKGVPEGLWMKCPSCEETLFKKAVESNLWVCPKCQHHLRISARVRVEQLLDPGTYEPFDDGLVAVDPLKFVDQRPYGQRISDAQRKTGEKDALLSGFGFVKGRRVVVDFEPGAHTAAARGQCMACHEPHGSARPKLLRAEGGALCTK